MICLTKCLERVDENSNLRMSGLAEQQGPEQASQ